MIRSLLSGAEASLVQQHNTLDFLSMTEGEGC